MWSWPHHRIVKGRIYIIYPEKDNVPCVSCVALKIQDTELCWALHPCIARNCWVKFTPMTKCIKYPYQYHKEMFGA